MKIVFPPFQLMKGSKILVGMAIAWALTEGTGAMAAVEFPVTMPSDHERLELLDAESAATTEANVFGTELDDVPNLVAEPVIQSSPTLQSILPIAPMDVLEANTKGKTETNSAKKDVVPAVNNNTPIHWNLESLQPDVHQNWNNSGQINSVNELTAIYKLSNGDRVKLRTGINSYEQSGTRTVRSIPLQLGWETKIDSLTVQPQVGLDFIDGSVVPNVGLKVSYPLLTGITLSADIQQEAYQFNAKTIENRISALRYGPSLFWSIDSNTSLFSSIHLGNYSDGNTEFQSFTRIEHKIGSFSVAGNLFTWNYQNPTDKGYFAPPDFLVYTAELGWEGDVIPNTLRCRLSIPFGEQRANGVYADAGGYQGKCTVKVQPNIEADLGYGFSNVKNQSTGLSTANAQTVGVQFRIKF